MGISPLPDFLTAILDVNHLQLKVMQVLDFRKLSFRDITEGAVGAGKKGKAENSRQARWHDQPNV